MVHKTQHSKGKNSTRISRSKIDNASKVPPSADTFPAPASTIPVPRVTTTQRTAAASGFAQSYPYIKTELIKIVVVTVAVVVILVLVASLLR